jgi:hypothetical protein
MTPFAAGFLRLTAVVLALLVGLVFGPIYLEQDPPPRKLIVVGVFAAAFVLGAALQLGLFLAPSAAERGPRAIVTSGALMLPVVLLCTVQLVDFVRDILQKGLGVLSKSPADLRVFGLLLGIEVLYGWTFVALWRAYRAHAASAA